MPLNYSQIFLPVYKWLDTTGCQQIVPPTTAFLRNFVTLILAPMRIQRAPTAPIKYQFELYLKAYRYVCNTYCCLMCILELYRFSEKAICVI